jgi:hypothetical protein
MDYWMSRGFGCGLPGLAGHYSRQPDQRRHYHAAHCAEKGEQGKRRKQGGDT